MTETLFPGLKAIAPQNTAPAAGRVVGRTRRLPRAMGFLAALCLAAPLFCGGCAGDKTTPPFLVGTWITAEEKYADRYLTLAESTITFGMGEGRRSVHDITRVRKKDASLPARYVFSYIDEDGEEWTLEISHFPDRGDTIQLQNSQTIWKKSGAGGP